MRRRRGSAVLLELSSNPQHLSHDRAPPVRLHSVLWQRDFVIEQAELGMPRGNTSDVSTFRVALVSVAQQDKLNQTSLKTRTGLKVGKSKIVRGVCLSDSKHFGV